MRDLSLRGIARHYRAMTGTLFARAVVGVATGSVSLRDRLTSLSRTQHSFGMSECVYGWTAAFEQTWTHIVIRIQLNPDAGIAGTTIANCRQSWANGITTTWSDQWACATAGEAPCNLTFEVDWTSSSPHHQVRVEAGSGRANMTHWYANQSGGVAAHEYGHMLGRVDEYADATCPARNPVNTGTVMDNNSANVPQRLVESFAANIGSQIVAAIDS